MPSRRIPTRIAGRSAFGKMDASFSSSRGNIPDFGASICICDLDCSMSSSMNSTSMTNGSIIGGRSRKFEKSVKFSASDFVAQDAGESLEAHYIIGEMLGEGGFGEVYACTHIQSREERAVKVIPKHHDEEENLKVIGEFEIVKDLDHPNILKLYALFESDDSFFLVTDLYAGGELYDELAQIGSFSEDEASILMNNVLSCINYCHQKGLAHRDLKPENVLLEENKSFDDLKIIDFGLAEYGDVFTSLDGSTYYMSPQVVEGEYGIKTDIWSCGVIAFVCLAGYAPFDGRDDGEVMEAVHNGHFDFNDPIWDEISEEAKDFVSWLLTYDEAERPSAQEALQHPWLKGARHKNTECSKRRESTRLSLGCLQSFQANSKLKQCVCSLIASQMLKKEEKEEIDMVFRTLDYDCDGKLTPEDLRQSYKEYFNQELSEGDIAAMFDQVNYSGSGAIGYSEFVASTLMEKNLVDESKLRAAFTIFDRDDKGYISNEDLRDVLALDEDMDDYIMNKIILQVDANGDGQIQYDEFRDMMFNNEVVSLKTTSQVKKRSSRAVVTINEELFEDDSEGADPLALSMSRSEHHLSTKTGGKSFRNVLDMFQEKSSKQGVPVAFKSRERSVVAN